jgi:hypothetical protein
MLLLVVGLVVYPLAARSQLGGAPGSRTGAPITSTFNELTCGSTSECHVNSDGGPGQVLIDAPATYTPGEAFAFTVRVEEEGRSTFGFQVAVKAANDTIDFFEHVGTLELVDTTRTRLVTENYVTHTQEGLAQNAWTVRWVAPADETRPVTIYAAGNAANGDGEREGDHIYTTSWAMAPSTSTAVAEEAASQAFTLARAYPNPFSASTTIAYVLRQAAPVTLSVYDALGRRVWFLTLGVQAAGLHRVRLDAAGLAPGLYLYELRTPDARASRPMLVMK